jgi:RNA polymerase sigma-70 factor (ECF subfamily)
MLAFGLVGASNEDGRAYGRVFLAAQGVDAAPAAELDAALDEAIGAALDAWPELAPDRTAFARFLGERIPSDVDAIEALRGRRPELYLVFACLRGDPTATELLDRRYFAGLADRLVRQRIPEDVATETVQQLRMKVFTGPKPLLLAYSGTGDLHGWLRITALRAAIRLQRGEMRRSDRDQETALADGTLDAGLQYQRKLYQEEFRAAFAEAVGKLTTRERNLLKHSVLYGANSDDLGALYQVHRATAARWLAAARERLALETQRGMLARLRIERSEYESILRLIQSQLDVSVARILS